MSKAELAMTRAPMRASLIVDSMRPSVFFDSLESLRGIAALLVVIYHFPPWYQPVYEIPLVRHGYLMVTFFFVLSGFVLCHSYGERITTGPSFGKFVVSRLARLYPIHIFFMLPFLFLELAKYAAYVRHGATGMSTSPSLAGIGHSLLANILLVQGLGLTANDPPLNFPSWSISSEFYTYLVFAVVVHLLKGKAFVVASWALVAASVGGLLFFGSGLGDKSFPLRCISGFFVGCLTRRALTPLRGARIRFDLPLVLAVVSLVALSTPWGHHGMGVSWPEQFSLPLTSALILSLVLLPGSVVNTVLLSKPLRWLGRISYSLYMSHALVLWCAKQALKVALKGHEVVMDGYAVSPLRAGAAAVVYPASIAVVLVVGALSFNLLEAPLRDAARRRISTWTAGAHST